MIQKVLPARTLSGEVTIPGDKSISHRYAMLAAIADGTSEIHHFASSQDCQSTLKCLADLGIEIRKQGDTVLINGRGLTGLTPARKMLDAGNSGTTIRLLSGILAGHAFESNISGDESLSRRPMSRIIHPLRMMGAEVESREGELPPLRIRGGNLKGVRYPLPIASAQVKSCVLLAGLYAGEITAVQETVPTRDHTEIALKQFGASVGHRGDWIEVAPGTRLQPQILDVPRDLSGAAFFLAAAALVPDSNLLLPHIGLNRRRRELLDFLRRGGLKITVENESSCAGEARGDLRVRYDPAFLHRALPPICGKLVAALIDEIPILTILGSQMTGGVQISDAKELRVKESDRIAALVENLSAMGAKIEEKPDGLCIAGRQPLSGADISTRGDHRIAMAFTIAGLVAKGETLVHEAECAGVSFPGFYELVRAIQPD
jgi:3-phosphoshikimate 1-carboxyvinyltransferase